MPSVIHEILSKLLIFSAAFGENAQQQEQNFGTRPAIKTHKAIFKLNTKASP